MNAVSGVYSNQNLLTDSMSQISSGKRINSAADDAAGLAIANKMDSQARGYAVAESGSQDMQNLLKTADGALAGISDALLRVRELTVQAQNGIYNDADRQILQNEADQLLDFVKNAAQDTEFNRIKILNGSFADKNLASNPTGNGLKINISNASLESLGLQNFKLTSGDALVKIDDAIASVSGARSKIGAQMNTIDHIISANQIAYVNISAAKSRIEDTDIGKAAMNLYKAKVIEQAQVLGIKTQTDNMKQKIGILM